MLILLFNNLAVQIPFDLQYNISVLKWTKKKSVPRFCTRFVKHLQSLLPANALKLILPSVQSTKDLQTTSEMPRVIHLQSCLGFCFLF